MRRRRGRSPVVLRKAAEKMERRLESLTWDRQVLSIVAATYPHLQQADRIARAAEVIGAALDDAIDVLREAMSPDARDGAA